MNHWSLFKRSWSLFWRNPTLWLFGLLAALGGAANFNFRVGDTRPLTALPVGAREMLQQILQSVNVNSLIAIGAVIGIMTFLIATFARAALYKLISTIEDAQPVSVSAGFRAAGDKLLPLLAVRVILALPTLILSAIAAGSFLSVFSDILAGHGSTNTVLDFTSLGTLAGLGAAIFIVGLLLGAISISAERAVVLDDLPILSAIIRGWQYIWSQFADYFTIGLIFFLLSLGIGLLFVCALAPFLLAGLGSVLGNLQPGVNIFAFNLIGPTALAAAIIGLILGTFISVFEASVWTLAYRVWHASAVPASTSV
jgi:hypothetical protein